MNYYECTVAALKKQCDERGISYPSKAVKMVLISLLEANDSGTPIDSLPTPVKRVAPERKEQNENVIDILSDDDDSQPPSKQSKQSVPAAKQSNNEDIDASIEALLLASSKPTPPQNSNPVTVLSSTDPSFENQAETSAETPAPKKKATQRKSRAGVASQFEDLMPPAAADPSVAPKARVSRVSRLVSTAQQQQSGPSSSATPQSTTTTPKGRAKSKKKKRGDDSDEEEEEEEATIEEDWIRPPRGGFKSCCLCQGEGTFSFVPNQEIVDECKEVNVDPASIVGIAQKVDCPFCSGKAKSNKNDEQSTVDAASSNSESSSDKKAETSEWSHLDFDKCKIEWKENGKLYVEDVKVERNRLPFLPQELKIRASESAPEGMISLLFTSPDDFKSAAAAASNAAMQNHAVDVTGVDAIGIASLVRKGIPIRLCVDAARLHGRFEVAVNHCFTNLRTQIDNIVVNRAAIDSEKAAMNDYKRRVASTKTLLSQGDISALEVDFEAIICEDGLKKIKCFADFLKGEGVKIEEKVDCGLMFFDLFKLVQQAKKFYKEAGDAYVREVWNEMEKKVDEEKSKTLQQWLNFMVEHFRKIMFEMPDEGGVIPLAFREALIRKNGGALGMLMKGESKANLNCVTDEELDIVGITKASEVLNENVECVDLD
eukprot:GDKJ01029199.1.p1 GENE.GDKJ01029199.1~~GDKJ01029199.1.p1  ORF type:complete len:669 (-),score=206.90 GDKJ01029199.1:40-2010(-)